MVYLTVKEHYVYIDFFLVSKKDHCCICKELMLNYWVSHCIFEINFSIRKVLCRMLVKITNAISSVSKAIFSRFAPHWAGCMYRLDTLSQEPWISNSFDPLNKILSVRIYQIYFVQPRFKVTQSGRVAMLYSFVQSASEARILFISKNFLH
jgi:hypothetical protein